MSKTYVILNDIQYPFHDEQCLALVKLFIKDIKPDGVRLNGDIVDCYSISSFTKDPMGKRRPLAVVRSAMPKTPGGWRPNSTSPTTCSTTPTRSGRG